MIVAATGRYVFWCETVLLINLHFLSLVVSLDYFLQCVRINPF